MAKYFYCLYLYINLYFCVNNQKSKPEVEETNLKKDMPPIKSALKIKTIKAHTVLKKMKNFINKQTALFDSIACIFYSIVILIDIFSKVTVHHKNTDHKTVF